MYTAVPTSLNKMCLYLCTTNHAIMWIKHRIYVQLIMCQQLKMFHLNLSRGQVFKLPLPPNDNTVITKFYRS